MLKSLYSRHNEIFLELLRSNRESSKLRQADLAGRLGHVQATVSKVEIGVRRLDVIELRAWLIALDVDFVAFMDELDQRLRAHPVPDARLGAGLRQDARRFGPHVSRRRRG
ncbi:MAG: XRE family transcriptional regulator [Aquabacterium sp.]|nr:MAG: XRE family transcriptional regulator [Aquabacterium sp.]TAL13482.1 MAG: XRE family transcriptional regulator [Aquabacterium sp.]